MSAQSTAGAKAETLSEFTGDPMAQWASKELIALERTKVRLRVMRDATANWHVHPKGEECFLVLEGTVFMDTELGTVAIGPGQFYAVPPNVKHRARVIGEARLVVIDEFPGPEATVKVES